MNDIMPEGYSGQVFAMEPTAQISAKNKKRDDTLAQLPLLREVLANFDAQIEHLNSLDSITADLSKSAAVYQKQVEANRLARNFLIQQRSIIQARVDNV